MSSAWWATGSLIVVCLIVGALLWFHDGVEEDD